MSKEFQQTNLTMPICKICHTQRIHKNMMNSKIGGQKTTHTKTNIKIKKNKTSPSSPMNPHPLFKTKTVPAITLRSTVPRGATSLHGPLHIVIAGFSTYGSMTRRTGWSSANLIVDTFTIEVGPQAGKLWN